MLAELGGELGEQPGVRLGQQTDGGDPRIGEDLVGTRAGGAMRARDGFDRARDGLDLGGLGRRSRKGCELCRRGGEYCWQYRCD